MPGTRGRVVAALMVSAIGSVGWTDASAVRPTATVPAGLRINEIQVLGTHNSYHLQPEPPLLDALRAFDAVLADSIEYSHAPLEEQLDAQGIRQIELDVFADAKGGLYAEPAFRRDAGVSRAVEERLVAEGALVRLMHGILAAGGVPLTFSAQAMAAALRPGVVALSHGAAARLHRLSGFELHSTIDVIGARGSHIRVRPPVHARFSRGRVSDHVVMVGPIPVTSVPLTLTLLTPEITRAQLLAAVDDAIRRGERVDTIREVAEQWREPGRPGPAQLLEILDAVAGGRRRTA